MLIVICESRFVHLSLTYQYQVYNYMQGICLYRWYCKVLRLIACTSDASSSPRLYAPDVSAIIAFLQPTAARWRFLECDLAVGD